MPEKKIVPLPFLGLIMAYENLFQYNDGLTPNLYQSEITKLIMDSITAMIDQIDV